MIHLDSSRFDAITGILGDTPFTVAPCFFLRRRECDVYTDDAAQPRYVVIVSHAHQADVYAFVLSAVEAAHLEHLADFLSQLEFEGGLFVPADLIQPIRVRRRIYLEAEGLCFTRRRIPRDFAVSRPGLARRLSVAEAQAVGGLPDDAAFLYQHFGTPEALLTEGLAFGVFQAGRLVSMAASLALTPKHCDVGVYTLRRHRNLGYATGCVEALFAEVFAWNMWPLWRIGIRQKLAIYFAEKLGMEEIGTAGREVYLRPYSSR